MEEMQTCKQCKRELELSEVYYYKQPGKISGFDAKCKECRGYHFTPPKPIAKEGYKICSKCAKELPLTIEYFYSRGDGSSDDGFRGQCMDCCRKRGKEYYGENLDVVLKRGRTHYKTNIVNERIRGKKYRQAHITEGRMHTSSYRAKKKGLPHTLTAQQWRGIKQYFDNKCCYCGEELPLEQEHFIALTKNGEFALTNIVCACRPCNASKSDNSFSSWYPKRDSYTPERESKILKFLGYKNNKQQLSLF